MGGAKSSYLRPEFDVRERVREAEQTGSFSLVGAGSPSFPVDLLRKVSALQSLDLSGNPIKSIPTEDLTRFASLTRINISNLPLETLPALSSLTLLSCVKLNGVPALRDAIKRTNWAPLAHLKEMCIASNDLDEIPDLSQNTELEVLSLIDNKLTSLPAWIGKLPALRELSAGDNDIKLDEIPEEVRDARVKITSWSNQRVPQKIIDGLYLGSADAAANWPALEERRITHVLSVVKKDPPFPGKLRYLVLDIEDIVEVNIIALLPKAHSFIEEGIKSGGVVVHCAAGVSRSASVVISYLMRTRQLTYKDALKQVWRRRPCIAPNPGFERQLDIYEKVGFQYEGAKYEAIIQQRMLEARDTGSLGMPFLMLPRVPEAVLGIKALTVLSLHQNLLEELPVAIGQLSALEELRLNNNCIRELPDQLGDLTSLRLLDASGNKLSAIPSTVCSLKLLHTLQLQRNILMALPDEVGEMTALQRIDVANNKLAVLPASMETLGFLESVSCGGNAKLVPPKWIHELRKKGNSPRK